MQILWIWVSYLQTHLSHLALETETACSPRTWGYNEKSPQRGDSNDFSMVVTKLNKLRAMSIE